MKPLSFLVAEYYNWPSIIAGISEIALPQEKIKAIVQESYDLVRKYFTNEVIKEIWDNTFHPNNSRHIRAFKDYFTQQAVSIDDLCFSLEETAIQRAQTLKNIYNYIITTSTEELQSQLDDINYNINPYKELQIDK